MINTTTRMGSDWPPKGPLNNRNYSSRIDFSAVAVQNGKSESCGRPVGISGCRVLTSNQLISLGRGVAMSFICKHCPRSPQNTSAICVVLVNRHLLTVSSTFEINKCFETFHVIKYRIWIEMIEHRIWWIKKKILNFTGYWKWTPEAL